MSINRVVISGNLTRDAELRSTASGLPVLGVGVAVNDRRKNQETGQWEDYANYIDCTMFGTRAQSLAGYLKKGTRVSIEGKLRWSQWETPDKQKRSKIEVIIDELEFMSSRNSNSQDYSGNYGNSSYESSTPAYGTASTGDGQTQSPDNSGAPSIDTSSSVYDDEIPF